MSQQPIAADPGSDLASVEPSRAWILGLVVEPDGTLTGPGLARADWPAEATEPIPSPDDPTVRP